MMTFFEHLVTCNGYDACIIGCENCPYIGGNAALPHGFGVCELATDYVINNETGNNMAYKIWEIMESYFTYTEGEI